MLVHHAEAGLDGVLGRAQRHRLAIGQDLALVRLGQPVQDVHQGGLARAVLAEQRVDLARLDGQVDPVVGHEGAVPLGDTPQFEAQPILRSPDSQQARAAIGPPWRACWRVALADGALGGRHDLAADDLRLDLGQLGLDRG
jgi:hypothetical protein